ncbi:chaperonin 10-like protein [Fimicolochytrium jonesii]|uniref:chaperonin 10-like protein n=1 Tax=Fimicolochytrium jonesii TaxID=1396493 RepID=UPI0022FF4275|nr:chaperonin 10-like protein [Fimicolochytrium jonesii]KAI8824452.1 chaperonin 10-like protein [Fimicolochytrium jonesii]
MEGNKSLADRVGGLLPTSTPIASKKSETETMRACAFQTSKTMKMVDVPKPLVTDQRDVIVKITTAAICGSDLHMYTGAMNPGMAKGDILGHEMVGIIESVGDQVTKFQVGQRVCVAGPIGCGECEFCKKGLWSCCDTTNPSGAMDKLYGARLCGAYGYTHLTGGYWGGQAEYLRVPFADHNLLLLPEDISDDAAVLLSDIACTSWHANELSELKEGDTVAIWGLGPVGLLTAMWAKERGAKTIIGIDYVPHRLETAQKVLGITTLNFKEVNVIQEVQKLCPGGVDCAIEVAGFRYAKSWLHAIETTLKLETDAIDTVVEAITLVKKGGHVTIMGDYFGYANHFPIGAMMEKHITVRGGQVLTQKYWKDLLRRFREGLKCGVDPTFIITHRLPLEQAPEGFRTFNDKTDNVIKVLLKPGLKA